MHLHVDLYTGVHTHTCTHTYIASPKSTDSATFELLSLYEKNIPSLVDKSLGLWHFVTATLAEIISGDGDVSP